MSDREILKALALLREAHELLKHTEVENLRKSARYLEESIEWLTRQGHINKDEPE